MAEEDPLDAYVAALEQEVQREKEQPPPAAPPAAGGSRKRPREAEAEEEEEEDDDLAPDFDDEDGDGADRDRASRRDFDASTAPLLVVDHAAQSYLPIRPSLYAPHASVAALLPAEVEAARAALSLSARSAPRGPPIAAPVASFLHLGLHADLLAALARAGYEAPTAIQAQCIVRGARVFVAVLSFHRGGFWRDSRLVAAL